MQLILNVYKKSFFSKLQLLKLLICLRISIVYVNKITSHENTVINCQKLIDTEEKYTFNINS